MVGVAWDCCCEGEDGVVGEVFACNDVVDGLDNNRSRSACAISETSLLEITFSTGDVPTFEMLNPRVKLGFPIARMSQHGNNHGRVISPERAFARVMGWRGGWPIGIGGHE